MSNKIQTLVVDDEPAVRKQSIIYWVLGNTAALAVCFSIGTACSAQTETQKLRLPVGVAQEILRVGSVDGPDALTQPVDAVITSDRRLYALFPREGRIRVFDEHGRITASVGRPGSGPGEVTMPGAVDLVNDSLVVYDPPRVTLFAVGDGGEPRTFQPAAKELHSTDGYPPYVVGLFAKGATLLWPRVNEGPWPDRLKPTRLYVLTDSGSTPAVLAELNETNRTVIYKDPDATGVDAVFAPHPFSDNDLWAMHGAAESLVVMDRSTLAPEGAVQLLLISPVGDTIAGSRIRLAPPRSITEAEIDSVVAEKAEFLLGTQGARPPNVRVGKDWARQALGDLPNFHAPAGRVVAASDGTIWIGRGDWYSGGKQQEWLRLDSEGVPIEWVILPKEMRLLAARDDVAWATVTDEFDVPYLVKLRLKGGRANEPQL